MGSSSDTTTQEKPFVFWTNDDHDGENDNITEEPINLVEDWMFDGIRSRRDLEDFAPLALYIGGLQEAIANGDILVGLKWKNATGTPAIKLAKAYEQTEPFKYLTDSDTALSQIATGYKETLTDKDNKSIVEGSGTFIFKPEFWSGLTTANPKKYVLFEGAKVGKGHLVITFHKADGTEIGEGPGVWMDLKNIKTMYERAKATPESIASPYEATGPTDDPPEPNMGWVSNPNGHPFEAAWDEDTTNKNYIVFVHGWNMSYDGAQNFAETAFKRMWWRGYKGRFAAFRWPTYWNNATGIDPIDAYLAWYNESEYIAWKSGKSLKQYVNQLPAGYARNLVAHSMGNIVAGSALKEGMNVVNYALLQAAVPAACYDSSATLTQAPGPGVFGLTYWDTPTPDDDVDPLTSALGYRGRLQSVGANLVNFFLPDDSATTTAWEFNNNSFKPYDPFGSGKYHYDLNAPAGQKLNITFLLSVGRFVRTPHEAMALVDQSPTKVVGADGRTGGAIDGSVNLSDSVYGGPLGFDTEHSAEFNRRIQTVQTFYYDLLDRLGAEQNFLDGAHP
jgi:pimeloyl-ACP methyl ester carboxylesterase